MFCDKPAGCSPSEFLPPLRFQSVKESQPHLQYRFPTGSVCRHASSAGHFAKQAAGIIDFMDGIEVRTASQLALRAVTLAVILPWVPIRQVLSHFNAGGNHFSDGSLCQQTVEHAEAG